jgi:hypothetical protein
MKRKQFIGKMGSTALLLLAGGANVRAKDRKREFNGEFVFLEAEQFIDFGGWDLDQQFMDQMGSPYLLAHGLGIPVSDAKTEIEFPSAGIYRVWVRTRDWVAPWNAPGAPGKFQLLINGIPIKETFGTKGAEWHWHDGGTVTVSGKVTLALHDLTGFEGRCEAILFCKDTGFIPVNNLEALTRFRRKLLGLPDRPENGGNFDFAVIGGGFAGICAALSAARNGLKVALIQDRPVLGGNASSEVRVWPEGKTRQDPFSHIGDIVEEIAPDPAQPVNASKNALAGEYYGDDRKIKAVRDEPRISLMTGEHAVAVETQKERITAVIIQNNLTSLQKRIKAKFFADCTGDATVGYLAGADYELSDSGIMGVSNLWSVQKAAGEEEVIPFPRCTWAINLTDKPFPGRGAYKGQWGPDDPLGNLGGWFWESGFDMDPIADAEKIRDLNFRAMYGAWDALKNTDKLYPNYRLGWSAFIAGKRESRRLMGDVVLTGDDFRVQKEFNDPAFPCSWHIDIHSPHELFDKDLKGQEFISKATVGNEYSYTGIYWAPYRTLYSRNIKNLFMAGRDISVSKEGLGPVRVMRTCGMMGEVIGKAASICINQETTPRGVYENHLDGLRELMQKPGACSCPKDTIIPPPHVHAQ